MIKEAIGTGATETEATEDAKRQLGLDDTADFEVELIQRAEKKKFGLFGGQPAKVRVSIKTTPADKAENFIREVLNGMHLEALQIEKTESEGAVKFNLSGDEVGFVIGRRGETLDSLQYLTSLVANHSSGDDYTKVSIDIGNYREKRENTLEILGRKLATKAVKTGRRTSLEPMNPYERRIIHTAVQTIEGAVSWSEGENANRHVVIGPDPKSSRYQRRGGYGGRGRSGSRRSYGSSGSRYDRGSDRSTPAVNPDRKPLNEGSESELYGRIDK